MPIGGEDPRLPYRGMPASGATGQWLVTRRWMRAGSPFVAEGSGRLLGFALQGRATSQRQALAGQCGPIARGPSCTLTTRATQENGFVNAQACSPIFGLLALTRPTRFLRPAPKAGRQLARHCGDHCRGFVEYVVDQIFGICTHTDSGCGAVKCRRWLYGGHGVVLVSTKKRHGHSDLSRFPFVGALAIAGKADIIVDGGEFESPRQ